MTRLILLRPHTHAGRLHAPSDPLDLESDLADWLIAEGVARPEPEPAKTKAGPDKYPTPSPEEPHP
jgi:hypothetical protein